jgi:adenylosuccinate synthase
VVTAVVGAQYGSEAKGMIVEQIAHDYQIHVRTGGPNAGHTIIHDGREWKMRSVPCGWINPSADLVIGPGAVVDLELLYKEVITLEEAGHTIRDRLWIDSKATVLDPLAHHRLEGGIEGEAHRLIGSTGEGVGPARMARIARGTMPANLYPFTECALVLHRKHEIRGWLDPYQITDTARMINEGIDQGKHVLLEGTQGSGLSLIHGQWPYVTSADTNSAQLCVDAGVSPLCLTNVILVARTFPIRVAGNSGPLNNETSFEQMGIEEERTTVTNKVRRIGWWDSELFAKAVMLNRDMYTKSGRLTTAITFLDYLFPKSRGATTMSDLDDDALEWIAALQDEFGVIVIMVGTGKIDGKHIVIRT